MPVKISIKAEYKPRATTSDALTLNIKEPTKIRSPQSKKIVIENPYSFYVLEPKSEILRIVVTQLMKKLNPLERKLKKLIRMTKNTELLRMVMMP